MTNLWMYDQKVILDTDRILQAIPNKEKDTVAITLTIDAAHTIKYTGPMAQALWDYLAEQSFAQGRYSDE